MNKSFKVSALLSFLIIMTFQLQAQEMVLDLNDVLELGVQNSLQIEAANIDLADKARVVDSAYNVFYPDISVSAGVTRLNTPESQIVPFPLSEIVPGSGIYDQVMLYEMESPYLLNTSVSGTFVLNPAMFTAIKLAKNNYQLGLVSREETEKRVTRDLKKSFYSMLLLEENISILKSSLATMEARYRQARSDYKNGYIPELVLLNIQVGYENMKPALRQLESAYDNAMQMFKISLGIPAKTEIKLSGSTDIETLDTAELEYSILDSFDLLALRYQIDQLTMANQISKYQTDYPSLILSASWKPMLMNPFSGDSWEDFGSSEWADRWIDSGAITLMLSWSVDSLLPKSAERNSREKMKDQIRLLESQMVLMEQMNEASVENVMKTLENTLVNLNSLELTVKMAERNLELTEEAYRAGIKDIIDVQAAEDDSRQASQNLLSEKINYLSALFDLEYLLNKTLYRP